MIKHQVTVVSPQEQSQQSLPGQTLARTVSKQDLSYVMNTDPSLSKFFLTAKVCAVGDYRVIYERSCPVVLELDSDETRAKVGGKDIKEEEELLVKIAVKVSSLCG